MIGRHQVWCGLQIRKRENGGSPASTQTAPANHIPTSNISGPPKAVSVDQIKRNPCDVHLERIATDSGARCNATWERRFGSGLGSETESHGDGQCQSVPGVCASASL